MEEYNTSLTASLKDAIEQKTDFQPLKEHVLTQRRKIHHLQKCVEEERCKILQIDSILEEILDTTSYFFGQISRDFRHSNGKNSVDRNK